MHSRHIKLASQVSKYDHRVIGANQKLFFFDQSSQGSCFFQPRGARIFNKLIEFMRNEYRHRNYEEVITPTIYDSKLYEKSGHWKYYESNMVKLKLGDKNYSLKPMNCPAHCVMYHNEQLQTSNHSLPIRFADFGTLHRNELSGSLTGLMRLRRFHQDDAHIFCRQDQIESEVNDCLQFARYVYDKFNLPFSVKLSLRPGEYLGDSQTWDRAEESLRNALMISQLEFQEQALEGAFYGPKIDIVVKDTMNREHQCATIQLDLQLSSRFELAYKDKLAKTNAEPVIIHRAILGSIERFMAILAENWHGRWPFWLSPFQAMVIPVHEEFNTYAQKVYQELRRSHFWVDVNLSGDTFRAKIREALLMPYNMVLVVGKHEAESCSVTSRYQNKMSNVKIDELIHLMHKFDQDKVHRADVELDKIKSCNN